jgi:glucose-6-phosphate 1-dehydrogenase
MKTMCVIFGASGDLTSRKLIPALYRNHRNGRLPAEFSIVGFARKPYSDENFRDLMKEAARLADPDGFREDSWNDFAQMLSYYSGTFDEPGDYLRLRSRLTGTNGSTGNYLYYLAVAPAWTTAIIRNLKTAGLAEEVAGGGYRRIIVEKPFGRDFQSARALNAELHDIVGEDQIYRIDHYLGKETVQNVLILRFGNAIFEPLWNRRYIDHVQITVAESLGVGHRGRYYDEVGALRDMFQNHLLQILTLVAMEPPALVEAESLRNEKVKVLRALREIPEELSQRFTVRGRYEGYLTEEGVRPGSDTETFAAIQLYIDNWRWQGVPFYLRSGKMMKSKVTEIVIQFRRPPTQIFDVQAGVTELFTNRLIISIQPDEGIHLRFITKVPDQGMTTRPASLDFLFGDSFGKDAIPDSYERLLLDAFRGEASLFTRSDEIEYAWKFIDCVRKGWSGDSAPGIQTYSPGSWGPRSADFLIGNEGRWWVNDRQEE